MKKFASGIVAGVGGTFALIIGVLLSVAIVAPERIPAPAITRVVHMDEKFRFIRDHPEIDPTLIAVGSSITWRQVSGAEMAAVAGGPKRFLNAAGVHMQAHQTRELARFLVDEYSHIRTLLVLTGLPDYKDCSIDMDPIFDRTGASLYAFDRWPAAPFYLRYFAPRRYIDFATKMNQRRVPFTGDLYIDEYGSGPVIVPAEVDLGLRYEALEIDSACVDTFVELSREMTERGIQTMIVFAPVHPRYRETYPESMTLISEIATALKSKTSGDRTTVLTMYDDPNFGAGDFYDAFHLQWPSARRLSRIIAGALDVAQAHDGRRHRPEAPAQIRSAPAMSLGVPTAAEGSIARP